ncbi:MULTISPECIES: hypothetical protein [unclassified Sphingobacterium]|uniref:hypothetical protein n=1 Tax=unclassified Sphingobacterium TaxID=2609468 RepID=UPI0025DCA744|nr:MULTISPECIES: hypothetical protein [unclassified Sphingobacterium]
MVNPKIEKDYLLLVQQIQLETAMNTSVEPFLHYLKSKAESFANFGQDSNNNDLLEFLRSVNRYADEFVFSEQRNAPIRKLINTIYESLAQQRP